jgi:aryl-alcohol dehydrogenase-like predicted oxidoreductase
MLRATGEGTARYAGRFAKLKEKGFYRQAQGLTVSSLGIGTYLGERSYVEAIEAALNGGINFIDTSLNYRNQESERDIGEALRRAGLRRDELVVCTKAGYLVPNAIPLAVMSPADIVGRMHSMAPAFLMDQLRRSLDNLRLETVDVFYLHNPETQLQYVDREEFLRRVRAAFAALEEAAASGLIGEYGMATWSGFRTRTAEEGLPLKRLIEVARQVGGEGHRFRWIQLPFNLAMVEALTMLREDGEAVLEVAAREGMTVVASASLLQSRLAGGLPEEVGEALPGLENDAQRALQFARSAPGITVALAGMADPEHVKNNLGVGLTAPADLGRWFPRR